MGKFLEYRLGNGVGPAFVLLARTGGGTAVAEGFGEVGGEFFARALTYILIGAIVVIPIWVIIYLLRTAKSRD